MSTGVLYIFLLVAMPGICALLAVYSFHVTVSTPTAVALIFALGYSIVALIAFLLALFGQLGNVPLMASVAVISVLLAATAFRSSPRGSLLRGVRLRPGCVSAGAATLAVVVLAALRVNPDINLQFAGRWRYWADGREIAVLGHLPGITTQWAGHYPPTVTKVLLNCFTAGFSSIAGANAVSGVAALYVLGAVGTAAALWALSWELGLRATSFLLPLLCATPLHFGAMSLSLRFADNAGLYKAEQLGRMVAFTALALAVRGLRTRRRGPLVVSGLLFAVASLTHGVATLAAALFGLAYVLAWALSNRRFVEAGKSLAIVVSVSLPVIAGVLLAAGGDLGLSGASSSYHAFHGLDPTALYDRKVRPLRGGGFYLSPWRLVKDFSEAAAGTTPPNFGIVLATLVVGLVLLLGFKKLRHRLVPLPLAAMLFGLLTLVVALIFSGRQNAYIPATFGQRRLFDYANLAVLLLILPWAETAFAYLWPRSRPGGIAFSTIMVVLLIGGVGYHMQPPIPSARAQHFAQVIDAIQANVPCGARMLVNGRSNATFEALAGRESVLEGMAPYLRPAELADVLHLIADAKAALLGRPSARAFFDREHVSYVVVLSRGGVRGWAVSSAALAEAGFQRVYHDVNLSLYKRRSGVIDGRPPPGFDCQVPPLPT